MAISINTTAFRDSLSPVVLQAASRLRLSGAVGDLESADGGVQAVVRDGQHTYQPWAGVTDRAFTGECECGTRDDLCVHAVAVVLTGFDQEVAWSGAAIPPSAIRRPAGLAQFADAVGRLAPRQLTDLIVGHASRDRLFAASLLRAAGMLDTSGDAAVSDFRAVLRDVSNVTNGSRWQISDIETAGKDLAAEAEILCAHPAMSAALEVVEEAILVWDDLSGHLHDAYHVRRIDPEEVSQPLVEAHRALCEQLGLDQTEILERVNSLADRCNYDTIDLDTYADLLGDHASEVTGRTGRW